MVRPMAVRKSGDGGGSGAAPRPSTIPVQREAQRMHLVQRHLEHAGGDLDRAGEAGGRRQDEGQRRWRRPQSVATRATSSSGGGRSVSKTKKPQKDSCRVAQLAEKLLLGRPRPARAPRPWRSRRRRLRRGQAPARILAGKTGHDRVADRHRDAKRPGRERRASTDLHPAEPAHADLGDPPAGFDPARGGDPGIDERRTGTVRSTPSRSALASRHRLATSGWVSRPRLGLSGTADFIARSLIRASVRHLELRRTVGVTSRRSSAAMQGAGADREQRRAWPGCRRLRPGRCRSVRPAAIRLPGGVRSRGPGGPGEAAGHGQ